VFLREHHAAGNSNPRLALPIERGLQNKYERYARMRFHPSTSSEWKFAGADNPLRTSLYFGGNPARMIAMLKQAGMIAVLLLLSEGLFVLLSAVGHGTARGTLTTRTVEWLGGATLCSSALMLLYSIGIRDEK
jgi:hypothetical protein